jgi:hypothetical protein
MRDTQRHRADTTSFSEQVESSSSVDDFGNNSMASLIKFALVENYENVMRDFGSRHTG